MENLENYVLENIAHVSSVVNPKTLHTQGTITCLIYSSFEDLSGNKYFVKAELSYKSRVKKKLSQELALQVTLNRDIQKKKV